MEVFIPQWIHEKFPEINGAPRIELSFDHLPGRGVFTSSDAVSRAYVIINYTDPPLILQECDDGDVCNARTGTRGGIREAVQMQLKAKIK
jgi:hypothetical protein